MNKYELNQSSFKLFIKGVLVISAIPFLVIGTDDGLYAIAGAICLLGLTQ